MCLCVQPVPSNTIYVYNNIILIDYEKHERKFLFFISAQRRLRVGRAPRGCRFSQCGVWLGRTVARLPRDDDNVFPRSQARNTRILITYYIYIPLYYTPAACIAFDYTPQLPFSPFAVAIRCGPADPTAHANITTTTQILRVGCRLSMVTAVVCRRAKQTS